MTFGVTGCYLSKRSNALNGAMGEEENVRVFLRLRPFSKYELNRRSQRAVEILNSNTVAVEDSEFTVDGVRFVIVNQIIYISD